MRTGAAAALAVVATAALGAVVTVPGIAAPCAPLENTARELLGQPPIVCEISGVHAKAL